MKKTLYRIAIASLVVISIVALTGCPTGTAPSTAPSIVSVGKGTKEREVKVVWTAPTSFDGISGYLIFYDDTEGFSIETPTIGMELVEDGSATKATFDVANFKTGVKYFFKIRAASASGGSDISEEASGYPYQTDAAPGAIAEKATVAAGDNAANEVKVTFKHLTEGFGASGGDMLEADAITSYKIIAVTSASVATNEPANTAAALQWSNRIIEDGVTPTADAAETTATIDGLAPGTAYKIYVVAVSVAGNGALSPISDEITTAQ